MPKRKNNREPSSSPPRDVPAWLALVVLAAAVWIVYGRALNAPFLFDDSLSVLQNRSITTLWPLVGDAQLPGPLNPPIEIPTSARPLVNLSFAINYHLGQFNPSGYHAVNILLHMLNAMLLWAILRRTLELPYFGRRFDRVAGLLALFVASLWAVHPLVTEAVAYITQRTELMVTSFYLATLYCCLRYWGAASPPARPMWLAAATLAGLAGAASKEVMVTAPVVVLLFERTFINSTFRDVLRRSWPLYLGLVSSWGLIAALQLGAPRNESAGFGLGVSVVDWWCTQAKVFVMYLQLALWPSPLLVHYELPVESFGANARDVALVALLAIATATLVWRRSALGFPAAVILLILAPTHLVPITTEIAAERRMYLPLAALLAMVVIGGYSAIRQLAEHPNVRWPLAAVGVFAVALAVAYGVASAKRLAKYNDLVGFWQENVNAQPRNHIAHMNLAVALAAAGHPQDAIKHYRESVRSKSDFVEGRYRLGLALAASGQLEAAIAELQTVVEQKPNAYKIRNNLGVVLFTAGRLPEAIAAFEKTLELQPDFAEAEQNLNRARQQSVLPKSAR